MQAEPLTPRLERYIQTRNLTQKFTKQLSLFLTNPRHPSLHTELLEPKELKFYSFRIDKKYRAVFSFKDSETLIILEINNHYA